MMIHDDRWVRDHIVSIWLEQNDPGFFKRWFALFDRVNATCERFERANGYRWDEVTQSPVPLEGTEWAGDDNGAT